MAYTISQKLNDNIRAVRLAIAHKSGDPLSDSDISELQRYSGFGGIKAILYPYDSSAQWLSLGATKDDLKLHSSIVALHDLLKENFMDHEYKAIINSLRNSVLTAFYTPEIVPKTLYTVLKEQGISPKRLYEPSAGAGIFITEATKVYPGLEHITAVEKDQLSGMVLTAINDSLSVSAKTHITGLEESPTDDNGSYDLVISNIPFGNFSVYDAAFPDKELSGKIHNYFFAKGLDKLSDGGLMAYITTDAFLNGTSNKTVREYLFARADFVSLAVLPDNLMKDTGNTAAPTHLLIVQKNESKERLSYPEQLLVEVEPLKNQYGNYTQNLYLYNHKEVILGDEIKPGRNQYGKAHETVWQHGDISAIGSQLKTVINDGLEKHFNRSLYQKAQESKELVKISNGKKLSYLPMPENKDEKVSLQLGLFDTAPAENLNRAMAYINSLDETIVQKNTAG